MLESIRYCRRKDTLDIHILTDALLAAGCVECDAKGRIVETIVNPPEEAPAPENAAPPAGDAPPAPAGDAAPPAPPKAPKARGGRPKKDKPAAAPQA